MSTPVTPDRRNSTYAFTSEGALIRFFSSALPEREIRKIIKEVKLTFVPRRIDNRGEDAALQLLRKYESELIRRIKVLQKPV